MLIVQVHADLDIDGPENVIPCYQTVEKALDQMRITIEPTAPEPPTFTVGCRRKPAFIVSLTGTP